MSIFFTSDQHWFHKNVIRYSGRPFASTIEMNEAMIERWNNVVKEKDIVYHLGDITLSSSIAELSKGLNGIKILVPGNHDKVHSIHAGNGEKYENRVKKYAGWGWHVVPEVYEEPMLGGLHIKMCHLPYKSSNIEERFHDIRPTRGDEDVLLCGHVHEKWKIRKCAEGLCVNVGVDQWDYTPVSLDTLIQVYKDSTL